jgi:hypothetical protein
MTSERCTKWEPVSGIVAPCPDISFTYEPGGEVDVTLYFSRLAGRPPQNLVLRLSGAIAAHWESESFGMIALPSPLPSCPHPSWSRWTFPLLRVEDSAWLAAYEGRNPIVAKGRVHFALVSMNDLVHVLALPDAAASWVDAKA